jgi:hypothetical protein
LSERQKDESMYYDEPGKALVDSVYSCTPGKVSRPNGGFALESMEAYGGWIGSVVELLKFTLAIDGFDTRPDILSSRTIQKLVEPPSSYIHSEERWYAKGWEVNKQGDWSHTGNLSGSFSLLVRTHDGYAWAILGNAYPGKKAPGDEAMEKHECPNLRAKIDSSSSKKWNFMRELRMGMMESVKSVKTWPSRDLFDQYSFVSP